MRTIAELIIHRVTLDERNRKEPRELILSEPILGERNSPPDQFEVDVFNHLLVKKETLGIKTIWRFKNLKVDGALELSDGRHLAVEVKFKMGWEKACQAEAQFRSYLKTERAKEIPVQGCLVIFGEFSGDWNRQPAGYRLKYGWNYWYEGHSEVDRLPLTLIQFSDGQLVGCPSPSS